VGGWGRGGGFLRVGWGGGVWGGGGFGGCGGWGVCVGVGGGGVGCLGGVGWGPVRFLPPPPNKTTKPKPWFSSSGSSPVLSDLPDGVSPQRIVPLLC